MAPAAGIVMTQAQTIRPATPHRTAESRWVVPTPTMAPVIVWVVETGMPKCEARKIALAPPVSAQNPPTGLSLVIFDPMVFTIRQPPDIVPMPIAIKAASPTQEGFSAPCLIYPP